MLAQGDEVMGFEEQFQNVEEVLNKFPIEARENYDTNKKTLKIEYDDNLTVDGRYYITSNRIILKNKIALKRELFHMACSNRKKQGTEFINNFRLSSEVSYFRSNGTGPLYGEGFSEGFVQSLANISNIEGRNVIFETYIIDLLVSIYGDYLYSFPLKNDPVGFYQYCSENMNHLRDSLDLYVFCLKRCKEEKKNSDNKIQDKLESILLFMKLAMKDIITEYNICKYQPQITRSGLRENMEKIFDDTIFWEAYELLPIKNSLIDEIEKIIHKELVPKRYSFSEKAQKMKKFLHFCKY